MTQQANGENKEFMRQSFDTFYAFVGAVARFDYHRITRHFAGFKSSFDRRLMWILTGMVTTTFLLMVLTSVGIEYMKYQRAANAPTLEERLSAPFSLAEREVPVIDFEAETYTPLLAKGLEEHTFLNASADNTLSQCMLAMGGGTPARCFRSNDYVYSEAATYLRDADNAEIRVVTTMYEDETQARTTISEMHRFSRRIGRVGNFVLVGDQPVNYYFSSTRNVFSFTWSHGPWVYSISGPDYEAIETVVQQLTF